MKKDIKNTWLGVRVESGLHEQLARTAAAQGLSVSAAVRDMAQAWVKKHERRNQYEKLAK